MIELQANPASVVQIIQLSLVPVFLIVGIGQFLNVGTGRLARIVDRARWFEEFGPKDGRSYNVKEKNELRSLARRMKMVNWSINSLTGAAVIICIDVILLLFNGIITTELDSTILILFVLGMVLITLGMTMFFLEVSIATASLRIDKGK